ncbi:hypothetical protein JCM8547_001918 [Rhodosporidiobolus lusitaniae]
MDSARMARGDSFDSHNDDMGIESQGEDGGHAGPSTSGGTGGTGAKKGKSKAAKEQDRKQQNRIAQREFRQRKQQYIKELEAKVALHEMGRDEQIERMQNAVKLLLEENQSLRALLASLGGFIGEGMATCLPRIGMEVPEFNDMINRTLLDNAQDALKLPLSARYSHAGVAKSASAPRPAAASTSAQRMDTGSSSSSTAQQSRRTSGSFQDPLPAGLTFPSPPSGVLPSQPNSAPPVSSFDFDLIFPNLTTPAPPPPAPAAAPTPHPGLSHAALASVRQQSMQQQTDEDLKALFVDTIKGGDPARVHEDVQDLFSLATDSPQMQAFQLIGYHFRNLSLNPNYNLPPSLRQTVTQKTVPHHVFFDGIIFPSLRDRLILLKDQYPLDDLIADFSSNDTVKVHGNDILQPEAWELSEAFLRKWWYVIDKEVLDISNRWRAERGQPPLSMRDIVPSAAEENANAWAGAGTFSVERAAGHVEHPL